MRFQFPYCNTNVKILDSVFRPKLLQALRRENLAKNFHSSPYNDWASQYEPVKSEYCLYGSTESEKRPPLIFESAYGLKGVDDDFCMELNIEDVFRAHTHSLFQKGKCDRDDLDLITEVEDLEEGSRDHGLFFLPVLLSLFFRDELTKLKGKSAVEKKDI